MATSLLTTVHFSILSKLVKQQTNRR